MAAKYPQWMKPHLIRRLEEEKKAKEPRVVGEKNPIANGQDLGMVRRDNRKAPKICPSALLNELLPNAAELVAKHSAAVRTLEREGYSYLGGELWQPPTPGWAALEVL